MKNDDKFDSLLREKLQDGFEAVPEGVWSAIESRLDEVAQPRVRPVLVWTRRACAALAAAAAVVLAVVFTGRKTTDVDVVPVQESKEAFLADVPVVDDLPAKEELLSEIIVPQEVKQIKNVVLSDAVKSSPAKVSSSDNNVAGASEPVVAQASEPASEQVADPVSEEKVQPVAKQVKQEPEEKGQTWEEYIATEQIARPKKVHKMSLSVFGDAAANADLNPNTPPIMRSAGSKVYKETTISETSSSVYSLPLSFGIGAKIPLTSRLDLGTGITYSLLGREFSGTYIEVGESGEMPKINFDQIKNTQQYIGIPLNLYFNILNSNRWNFYVYAGGMAEKCLSNKFYMTNATDKLTLNGSREGIQLSVDGGLGLEYSLTNFLGIYLDPSVRYYFKSKQPKSIRTQMPLNMGAELGIRIKL